MHPFFVCLYLNPGIASTRADLLLVKCSHLDTIATGI